MKDIFSYQKRNLTDWAWLVFLLLTPFILWILPSDFFDNSEVILCPSRFLFNFECLGCGMTRAVMHMHHLEFEDAIYFNYGVVVIFPALVVVWTMWVIKAGRSVGVLKPSKKRQSAASVEE